MNHLSINKKLLSLLVSGSLALSLGSCTNKKYDYLPMSDIFYDENVDGLDDFFETRISDSDRQISDLTTLERSIACIKNLSNIDFSDTDITFSKEYVVNHLHDINDKKLDEIEADYHAYESLLQGSSEMSEDLREDSIRSLKDSLYEDLILLLNHVNVKGRTICYQFGNRLYDSIILSTMGYSGNEDNVEASIYDVEYKNSGVHTFKYTDGDFYDSSYIDSASILFSLIGEVGRYDAYKDYPKSYDLFIQVHGVSEEQFDYINELQGLIDFYKVAMATSFEADPIKNFFIFDSGNVMIKSGECDYSSITR